MPTPQPVSVSPIAAIRYLEQKLALPTETFTDVWAAQHARAFVVAGANTEALVADFHQAVTRAIAEGQSLATFRKSFDEIVAKHGWSYRGARGWRSRVIYETNMRQAFLNAKWERFWANRKSKPYLRYVGILDERIRPLHREWHNTVLPITDPWWDTHYPMNGWGCRCDVEALDDYWVKKLGLRVQPEAPRHPMVRREVRSASGRYFIDTPKGIDPGFGYNVGKAAARRGDGGDVDAGKWVQLVAPKALATPALPPLPLDTPAASRRSYASPGDVAGMQAVIDELFGDGIMLRDPAGALVSIGRELVLHLMGRIDGREAYLPFLPELVTDPAEIWIGFAQSVDGGRVELRRRYVKLLKLGPDRFVGLVADAAGREWTALTFFQGKQDRANALRHGYLLYRRSDVEKS